LKLKKKIQKNTALTLKAQSRQSLEAFLAQNSRDGGFLQSDYWANFQRSLGREVIEIYDGGFFRQLLEFHALPWVRGYFFVPRGPIIAQVKGGERDFKLANKEMIEKRFLGCMEAAKKDRVAWIRIEPQDVLTLKFIKKLARSNSWQVVKSKKNHQPPQTLMLELNKNQEELLARMKSKTRYNIRLAKKKGVEIQVAPREDAEAEGHFWRLSQETAQRNSITLHSRDYYQKMLETIPGGKLKLYLAYYQNKVIAAGLVSFYGGVATYLHGASDHHYRNLMAPYLLQWQAILDARTQNFSRYDFGGVRMTVRGEAEKGGWEGITRFKNGFCPQARTTDFPGCYDLILNKRTYWTYRRLQSAKDFSRNLKGKLFKRA
jgi:lipid II:glycine glycyltransferase (peptidoglycan interpeptide bridge formation enzyme)